MASPTDRRTGGAFIKSQGDFSVPDFCHIFRYHLPQVVSLKEDRKSKAKDVRKNKIYFVGKVCCEKKVTVDLVKKKKSRGTVLLPLSHPARVCLAGTQNESPASEFTIEQVLNNHTCPCDVIVAPHRHFRLQLKRKEVVTNDYVLRLQGIVDEFYLLGNPVTESSISDEEVLVLTGPRLQLVTGITGYPGEWSSFLNLLSTTLKSQSKDRLRSLGNYQDISPDLKDDDEHLYDGLVKTKGKNCVYELTWESHTGAPLLNAEGVNNCKTGAEDNTFLGTKNDSTKQVSGVGDMTKDKFQRNGKENNKSNIKGEDSASSKIEKQTRKPHSKAKATDRNHLYDVILDPETQKPVILGHRDVNSSKDGHTAPQNTEITKGVAISNIQVSPSEEHIDQNNSPQLPNESNLSRNSFVPSLPPKIQVPKKYGILISDLPKPPPRMFLSLDRNNPKKSRVNGGSKLNRSQSDMGFGELVNANNIQSTTSDSVSSLSAMSVDDLAHWLNTLHMKCVDKFVEHSIDGAKLLRSTEEIFQSPDIGMSKLDILRLRRFIRERCV